MAPQKILQGREVLLLEDEPRLRKRLAAYLEAQGAEVTEAVDLASARRCLRELVIDYALIDLKLPDGESFELLREGVFPAGTGVVVMTADGGVSSAVEALKLGAGDYLTKPFDPEELPLVFARLDRSQKRERRDSHQRGLTLPGADGLFLGESLRSVTQTLERILEADRRLSTGLPPVLIEGETGTGKTTLARWLHQQGPRAKAPWVELNCSTLPEQLAESELFGHERGAFTDARKDRIGLFEAADGGTLFLDEIPSLSPALQAKVLTVVEDGLVRRVGSNKAIPVDVRLITATNRNLSELVAVGQFREDLYHRLNLLHLWMPPLRERGKDTLALTEHLLTQLRRRYRLEKATLSERGATRILAYHWPGNVRELSHVLERALVMEGERELDLVELESGSGAGASAGGPSGSEGPVDWLNPAWVLPEDGRFSLDQAIGRLIQMALEASGGNVSAAARRLGVTRDFLRYRLDKSDQSE